MSTHPLDAPQITSQLFYPRSASAQKSESGAFYDGTIQVDEDVVLGYRFFVDKKDSPVILFFHGNGEVASDYIYFSHDYKALGLSLLVVDYRGYGWSTGRPLTSKMLPDAAMVADKLAKILDVAGVNADVPIFVMGRSLGSAPAIYLALTKAEQFKGLIVESGYADAPSLFRRLGIPIPDNIQEDDSLPINNTEKMKRVKLPLLVIHGEIDNLIPVSHGKEIYTASPIEDKRIVVISGAGHNNLTSVGLEAYFSALSEFVNNQL